MQVYDAVEVRMWAPRARFRYQVKPRYTHTDFPWEYGVGSWATSDGVTCDPDLQAVFPVPVRVPHNNLLTPSTAAEWDAEFTRCTDADGIDADLPSLTWVKETTHTMTTSFLPVWGRDTGKPIGLYCFVPEFLDADTGEMDLQAPIDCMAFACTLSVRAQPIRSLASGAAGGASTTPDEPSVAWLAVAVGEGADRVWWRVRIETGSEYLIDRRVDSEPDWEMVQSAPRMETQRPSTEDFTKGPQDLELSVEFRLIGGQLLIRIGDMRESLRFEENRQTAADPDVNIWSFSRTQVSAQKVLGLTIYGAQVKWRSHSSMEAPEQYIGFFSPVTPDTAFRFASDDAPGWTPSVTGSLSGPTVTYALDLDGPVDGTYKGTDYADNMVAIRSVHLLYPGETEFTPAVPFVPNVGRVIVRSQFDPSALTASFSADIFIPANKVETMPDGTQGMWGPWLRDRGQLAVEVWGSRTLPSGSMGPPELLFSGYGNCQSRMQLMNGMAMAVVCCQDRKRQLMSPRANLPWMDGWNVFYAIYSLAQECGVTIDDMAFSDSIPPDAYDDSLDEDGLAAYFLPIGTRGSVLTRPARSTPLWAHMLQISYSIGYMLTFDVWSRLQFRKYRLPTGVKRYFFESDHESAAQPGGGLEGCWNLSWDKNMDAVRSDMILVGIETFGDKYLDRVTAIREQAIIDDPLAFNHLGYRNPAVWIDNQFTDEAYSAQAGAAMHRATRMPDMTIALRTWFQPDIFPLDVIGVVSVRSGTTGVPYVVLGAQHVLDVGGPFETTLLVQHFVPTEY